MNDGWARARSSNDDLFVNRKRSMSVDTAMQPARYLGTSAAVRLRLQVRYDLEVAERKLSKRINREVKVRQQPHVHS